MMLMNIFVDGFILRMVVNNLIENAFKYSDNKSIEVNLFYKNGFKVLEVKDTKITVSFTARNKESYEKLKEMMETS